MTQVLSLIAIVVLVCFASNLDNMIKELRNSGVSEVDINFTNGSVCGKRKKILKCSNMYIIKIKDKVVRNKRGN